MTYAVEYSVDTAYLFIKKCLHILSNSKETFVTCHDEELAVQTKGGGGRERKSLVAECNTGQNKLGIKIKDINSGNEGLKLVTTSAHIRRLPKKIVQLSFSLKESTLCTDTTPYIIYKAVPDSTLTRLGENASATAHGQNYMTDLPRSGKPRADSIPTVLSCCSTQQTK